VGPDGDAAAGRLRLMLEVSGHAAQTMDIMHLVVGEARSE
jgi:hypothetical protein